MKFSTGKNYGFLFFGIHFSRGLVKSSDRWVLSLELGTRYFHLFL